MHDWDEAYGESEAMWSGNPNAALVTEAGRLSPGLALDVGSGEGADAIWLEQQGWEVVGLEPSSVAIGRAAAAAKRAGIEVEWVHGELGRAFLPHAEYDLVSACYLPLFTDSHEPSQLTGLVAPGGHLLVVHHADWDSHAHEGTRPTAANCWAPRRSPTACPMGSRSCCWRRVSARSPTVPARTTATTSSCSPAACVDYATRCGHPVAKYSTKASPTHWARRWSFVTGNSGPA